MFKNIWRKLSSGQKLTMLGSLLLMLSLFLNWFSDKDVFRSGDTYSALGGPLYLAGLTMLLLAAVNIGLLILSALRQKRVVDMGESRQGKIQMIAGFASMYLLMLINSVFFHPRFGLNILEKKPEIGVMLALAATVMICCGGYLSYRKKFEGEGAAVAPAPAAREKITGTVTADSAPAARAEAVTVAESPLKAAPALPSTATAPVAAGEETTVRTHVPLAPQPVAATPAARPAAGYFSERDPRGKTEYERSKLYENLKKTMVRDTLTPEQRRKLREKEAKENAFSANFGKGGVVGSPATTAAGATVGSKLTGQAAKTSSANSLPAGTTAASDAPSTEKKPQMYRMDL
jgi:hypothetical protein